ncbi:MAG: hypothetical protein FJX30_01685 [Alphaproteobacteria bacterium]|nr:hypothetical protein [Alphaproteobacteria bacterium]
MADFKVEITSIEGVLFGGLCQMVVLPSISGDIGVMRGHESIISNLRVGEIQIFDNLNNVIKSIAISGGFAEMQSEDKLLVLVNV